MNMLRTAMYFILGSTLFFATTASAEIMGQQPGTSSNPKDNVPKQTQDSSLGESAYPKGDSGPGTRSDDLVGMRKEKPHAETEQELQQNVDKTHGGGAAKAAEALHEKGEQGSRHSK